MLTNKLGVDEDISVRGFHGLFKDGIHKKGKHVDWVNVVIVPHISTHR